MLHAWVRVYRGNSHVDKCLVPWVVSRVAGTASPQPCLQWWTIWLDPKITVLAEPVRDLLCICE